MGFPDNYTDLPKAKKTNRYQATGNSWAVPVVRWLGSRIVSQDDCKLELDVKELSELGIAQKVADGAFYVPVGKEMIYVGKAYQLNGSAIPEFSSFGNMADIVSPDAPEDIYISPVGCYGIIRRKQERNMSINARLEEVLLSISSQMSPEEIENRSRIQKRGRFSDVTDTIETTSVEAQNDLSETVQISLFDHT